jgi:hypothetical protein
MIDMKKWFAFSAFKISITMLLAANVVGCVSNPWIFQSPEPIESPQPIQAPQAIQPPQPIEAAQPIQPPQVKSDWYLGDFEGRDSGKKAKKLNISCSAQSKCRLSMPTVSLTEVAAVRVDTTTPQKALAHAQSVYKANPGFFEERFKQDLAQIRPLLKSSTRFESCVDVGGRIKNMFYLCSTTDDPGAQKGAVILGMALGPYTESACRKKLYCEHYLIPVARK